MKFKIRFADQIVGISIIAALAAIIFVIFMLGSKQRWFDKDYYYRTFFESGAGLSENMVVQFKGFPIGNVKSFHLSDDDRVEIVFSVYEEYHDRVRHGSLVEIMVSPVGLGNQFLFYPGLGNDLVEENDIIPSVNSREGKELIQKGLGYIPSHDDSITLLLSRINVLLEDVDKALVGDDASTLGRTLLELESTMTGVNGVVNSVPELLEGSLVPILANVKLLTDDLKVVTTSLADPDGAVLSILSSDGAVLAGLENSLTSVAGILENLEKTTAYLPKEMPQIMALIAEVRTTLLEAEKLMVALQNNPLLKGGVPARVETQSNGTSPRNISF
jgi:phospholipid/cholesterol/gamma-HCH transport system substrate-binding protein